MICLWLKQTCISQMKHFCFLFPRCALKDWCSVVVVSLFKSVLFEAYIYMWAIAGQTTGPTRQIFLRGPQSYWEDQKCNRLTLFISCLCIKPKLEELRCPKVVPLTSHIFSFRLVHNVTDWLVWSKTHKKLLKFYPEWILMMRTYVSRFPRKLKQIGKLV